MPLFLSLLDEVVDRWYTAVGRMNPVIYDKYKQHSDIVTEMQLCFDRILDDDTSSVLATRSELSELLGQFDEMMNNFAEVFSYPMELREFYYNISSRLKLTTDSMWEGTYGW